MDTVKLMTLFAFIIFGAYAEYNAGIFTGQKTTAAYASVTHQESSVPDNKFMQQALELSHHSNSNGHRHPAGSVVVKNGVIVGEGFDEVIVMNDPSAHAEFRAIRNALKNVTSASLEGCVVYSSTQPCTMCQNLISQVGISRLYYCIPEKVVRERSPGVFRPESPIIQTQIMADEVQKSIGLVYEREERCGTIDLDV